MAELNNNANANINNVNVFTEPENCAHDCSACAAGCEFNSNGENQGKFWEALDSFSEISSDDLLNALNSFADEEDE